jgi:hypothetical protein
MRFVPQRILWPYSLTDFLNPLVSATVSQEAFRKIIRIRAGGFVVNV